MQQSCEIVDTKFGMYYIGVRDEKRDKKKEKKEAKMIYTLLTQYTQSSVGVYSGSHRSWEPLSSWLNEYAIPIFFLWATQITWYKITYLMTNSADPGQTASSEADWSESTVFAMADHIHHENMPI